MKGQSWDSKGSSAYRDPGTLITVHGTLGHLGVLQLLLLYATYSDRFLAALSPMSLYS